jgi:phage/plasmid-like protein (TIGR03299 family)
MSHELEIRADGTGAAAYAYKPAWHGLGIVIDELMTAADCLRQVPELASDIVPTPVYAKNPETGFFVPIDGYVANVREDDFKPLAVVGERYKILQNTEALSFLDDLVDSGEAKYEAVISLKGGAKVSLLARLPREVKIGDDELATYVLLSNSHDGSSAITLAATPIRVVCQNTLTAALSSAKRQFKVRHTTSLAGRLTEAREALGVVFNYMSEFEDTAERLLDTSFTDAEFEAFLSQLVVVPEDAGRGQTLSTNTQDVIRSIAYNHLSVPDSENDKKMVRVNLPDLQPIKNTKWWAYNAVSTYNQHFAPSKKTKRATAEENRFKRVMGDAPSITDKAFGLLTTV